MLYISPYASILGGLDASTCTLTSFILPQLTYIGGSLRILGNSLLSAVEFPSLLIISGDISLISDVSLTTVAFPSLQLVGGAVSIDFNSAINLINFPSITHISGSFYVAHGSSLTLISLPVLTAVQGSFSLFTNSGLQSLYLGSLTAIGSNFIVEANSVLQSILAPNLSSVAGDINVDRNAQLIMFSAASMVLVSGNRFFCQNNLLFIVPPSLATTSAIDSLNLCVIQNGSSPCSSFAPCFTTPAPLSTAPTTITSSSSTSSTTSTPGSSSSSTSLISSTSLQQQSTTTPSPSSSTILSPITSTSSHTMTSSSTTTTAVPSTSTTKTSTSTVTSSSTRTTTRTTTVTSTSSTSTTSSSSTSTSTSTLANSVLVISWGYSATGSRYNTSVGRLNSWYLSLDSQQHSVVCFDSNDNIVFQSAVLNPGVTFDYSFDNVGVYVCYDGLFQGLSMTLVVNRDFSTSSLQSTGSSTTTPAGLLTNTVASSIPQTGLPSGTVVIHWGSSSTGIFTTVAVGTTITWVLDVDQSAHSVTAHQAGSFSSGLLVPGSSFSYQFTTVGQYIYGDTTDLLLVGTIFVINPAVNVLNVPWGASTTPGSLNVLQNTFIIWSLNLDASQHSVACFDPNDNLLFGSGILAAGSNYAFEFNSIGSFACYDALSNNIVFMLVFVYKTLPTTSTTITSTTTTTRTSTITSTTTTTTSTSTTLTTTTPVPVLSCVGLGFGPACYSGECLSTGVCFIDICFTGPIVPDGSTCHNIGGTAGSCLQGSCIIPPSTTSTVTTTSTTNAPVLSCVGLGFGPHCYSGECLDTGVCFADLCYTGPVLPDGSSCQLFGVRGTCSLGTCITPTSTQTTTSHTTTSYTTTTQTTTAPIPLESCVGQGFGVICDSGACLMPGICFNDICFTGPAIADGTICYVGSTSGYCNQGYCETPPTSPTTTTATTTVTTTPVPVKSCVGLAFGVVCDSGTCLMPGLCFNDICYTGPAVTDGTICEVGGVFGTCFLGYCDTPHTTPTSTTATTTVTSTFTTTTPAPVESCVGLAFGVVCDSGACLMPGLCFNDICYTGPAVADGAICEVGGVFGTCSLGLCTTSP